MKAFLLISLCLVACSCTDAGPTATYKKEVTIWYEAFNTKDPRLVDRILSEDWVDIPTAPGQPAGREGMKHLVAMLTTTFPDLKVTNEEILREGNKVIVRSEMTGTQRGPFAGLPPQNRTLKNHDHRYS
jgi:predicted ester cyclase